MSATTTTSPIDEHGSRGLVRPRPVVTTEPDEPMSASDRRLLQGLWIGAAGLTVVSAVWGIWAEFVVFAACLALVSVPALRGLVSSRRIGRPHLSLSAAVRRGEPALLEVRFDDPRWVGREIDVRLRYLVERHVVDGGADRTELAAVSQRVRCEPADAGAIARLRLVPPAQPEDVDCDPLRETLRWALEVSEVRPRFAVSFSFDVTVRD